MRAALYARFSTDLQNVGSIADQLHVCRRHAAGLGAIVVAEYSDAGISGASMANRPDLQRLLEDARAGAFDVVISEHMDRLSRSGADTWGIYEDLRTLGVKINTVGQGDVGTMHVGLGGTMSALFLEELARKTHRGLEGVARAGRHAGGKVYGYRIVRDLKEDGSYTPGLLKIDPSESAIVVEIYERYAAGWSPRAIAGDLNARGLASPRGGLWNASTINGNAQRGNGVLHNELYRGELVWGRQTWVKVRQTGTRRSRAADPANIVRTPVPHLRIVDDELWDAVRARYAAVKREPAAHARQPKRILYGLVRCGECEGPMIACGPQGRFVCSTRREKGSSVCGNGRTAKVLDVEQRVFTAVRDNLLHPAAIEEAIAEYHAETNRRLAEDARDRAGVERELAEVKRRAARLIHQLEEGEVTGAAIKDRLAELEERRARLEAQLLTEPSPSVVSFHPAAAGRYRRLVEALQSGIESTDELERVAVRQTFRDLVKEVRIIPGNLRGQYDIEILGDLAQILNLKTQNRPGEDHQGGVVSRTMGAGVGFEPTTFRL